MHKNAIVLLGVVCSVYAIAPPPAKANKRDSFQEAMTSAQDRATLVSQAWSACLILNTRKYAALEANTDLAVDAAFGTCSRYEAEVRQAVMAMEMAKYAGNAPSIAYMVNAASMDADRTTATLRLGHRGQMIAMVLDERATPPSAMPSPAFTPDPAKVLPPLPETFEGLGAIKIPYGQR